MTILVTGAAGFVGSHLVDLLLGFNKKVLGIDNLSTGKLDNLSQAFQNSNFEFVEESSSSATYLREIMPKCSGIFHLAGSVGVINVSKNPLETLFNNINSTKLILELAAEFKIRTIFVSSSEVYGNNIKPELFEHDELIIGPIANMRWHYAISKIAGEAFANSLYIEKELKVSICRLFNTAGPRQRHEFGMVIPTFIESAITGENLTIFGDGKQCRVFCHVNDAVSALFKVWKEEACIGETLNIGGEAETNIIDLATFILHEVKSKSEIVFLTERKIDYVSYSDIRSRVPNTSKLRTLTDWKPEFSLNDIILDSIAFHKKD